jgi:hypothetical protein
MNVNTHTSTGLLHFTKILVNIDTQQDLTSVPPSPLSLLLTKLLTTLKEKIETHRTTTYARSGVNKSWITRHSKELANSKAQNLS